MSDSISLQRKIPSLTASKLLANYSKIIIDIDDETQIVVGDDSGETLEYTDPFGTRVQAESQLEKLRQYGYQYQPYKADDAFLDPAAEIGDGVSVNNIYGGIYKRSRTFTRLMRASIGAPHTEEINSEFKYESPSERKIKRQLGEVKATLLVQNDRISAEIEERTELGETLASQIQLQADSISAKVSKTGGNGSSFGWDLFDDSWALNASGKTIFCATELGVEIDGKITARTGFIGAGDKGFVISDSAIYNNINKFDGTQSTGIYLGTDGIQLGQNFKVDQYGNLNCKNATLTGTLSVGGQKISASTLRSGAQSAYNNGSSWSGAASWTNTYGSSCVTGSGYGFDYNDATGGSTSSYPTYFTADYFRINKLLIRSSGIVYNPHLMTINGKQVLVFIR